MDYSKMYNEFKEILLKKIQGAAENGDIKSIKSFSFLLEELEGARIMLDKINEKFNHIEKSLMTNEKNNALTPIQKGNKRVKDFVEDLRKRGIILINLKGRIYKSTTGKRIGIGTGSELEPRGTWFIGLPSAEYDSIVLICESKDGQKHNLIFSSNFIKDHFYHFAIDKQDQIKFKILKRKDQFLFDFPGIGKINIDQYLNNYANLS